jgi:polysaccharide biosynthesis transport protein
MDLKQFILALGARRKAFLMALAAVIFTAIAVALIVPKKYVATATLMVDARDEQTMRPDRMSARERSSYIQTQVDLLRSNRVATQVARDLKLAQRPGVREAWEKDTAGAGQIDDWIAAQLIEGITVDTSVSNVMMVNFAAPSAKFAAEVANGFSKAYLDTVLALRTEPSREAAEWFDEQLKVLRTQVVQAQTKLNSFQKAKGILSEDRLDVESTRLQELSTQLLAARNATYDAQSRYKHAAEFLSGNASSGASSKDVAVMADSLPEVSASPAVQAVKTALVAAEGRLETATADLGPNHPAYQRAAAEVQGLRVQLASEMKKVVAGLNNSAVQARRREEELKNAFQSQQERLLNMRDSRVELAIMVRDVENAQRTYGR